MQPLQKLDWPTTLTGSVAVPAPGVHVERRSVLLRPEGALAPPIRAFGLLRILLDLEGAEEVTPVGVLAESGKIFGKEVYI